MLVLNCISLLREIFLSNELLSVKLYRNTFITADVVTYGYILIQMRVIVQNLRRTMIIIIDYIFYQDVFVFVVDQNFKI